jgi:hypothetical protein
MAEAAKEEEKETAGAAAAAGRRTNSCERARLGAQIARRLGI